MSKKNTSIWLGVFFFALIVRLGMVVLWVTRDWDAQFLNDGYILLAQHWLGWLNNLTKFDLQNPAPGFAMFCALLFKVIGSPNLLAVRVSNAVFSSLACVLIGLWAARVKEDRRVGLLASVALIFSPMHLYFAAHLQSESMFVFLEVSFFCLLLRWWPDYRFPKSFSLGFLAGITTLTRSVFAVYLPLFSFVLLVWFFRRRIQAISAVLIIVGWSVPIALWTAHNWKTYHQFIPLTIQSGLTLYAGISLNAEDRANRIIPIWGEMKEKGITEWADQDRYFRDLAIAFIREHPLRYASILARKSVQYWRPWPYPPYPLKARIILGFYYAALFLTALVGMWLSRDQWERLLPVYALFVTLSIAHSFFDTSLRYRMPLEAFLCAFAAIGAAEIGKKFFSANRKTV